MRRIRLISRASAIALIAILAAPAYGQTAPPDPSVPTTPSPLPSYQSIPFASLSQDVTGIHNELDAATARVFEIETADHSAR